MSTFTGSFKLERRSGFFHRTVALLAVLGAGVAVMGAQSTAQTGGTAEQPAALAQPALNTQAFKLDTSADSLFSSSSSDEAAPGDQASLHPTVVNFADAMQYGGGQRQRYGRPRYRGANTNSDGSSKWIFYGGAGFTQPVGNTWHYLTPSYGIEVGGGRQFNKHFAVPIEFDYDHFGFTKQTIANQITIYDTLFPTSPVDGLLDGSSHVWSFTVDPTYTVAQGDTWGAYVVAGAGFYHKTATFTTPQTEEYCDYFGYCYQYEANAPFDSYTSNAVGFNGGFGVTYKFSRFANQRFFGEVRYVFVDNSQRQGITVNNTGAITDSTTNFYPANSNRTTYLPIKFGIRF